MRVLSIVLFYLLTLMRVLSKYPLIDCTARHPSPIMSSFLSTTRQRVSYLSVKIALYFKNRKYGNTVSLTGVDRSFMGAIGYNAKCVNR